VASLELASNHKPTIVGTDDGIWRRVRLIAFTAQIPSAEQDRHLISKLKLEGSGFLNWALEGLREWHAHGLQEPQAVLRATAEYRSRQDVVRQFVDECCVQDANARCAPQALNMEFVLWCQDNSIQFKGSFAAKMKEMGFQQPKSNGKRFWRGFRPEDRRAGAQIMGGGY
jgi:putative DNA primase/helicase